MMMILVLMKKIDISSLFNLNPLSFNQLQIMLVSLFIPKIIISIFGTFYTYAFLF